MKTMALTLVCLPLLLGAATKVTLNESLALEVEPDKMQTTVAFEERSMQQQALRHHFNTLVKTVKRFNEGEGLECRGGSYRVAPQYNWTNNRQEFAGYRGTLEFACSFADIDAFNALSQELDTVAAAYKGIKRQQGNVDWIVSDALAAKSRDTLESRLIRRLESKGEHLSQAMQQRCSLASIEFLSAPHPYPVRNMLLAEGMAKSASVPIEGPIQSDASLSLNARAEYRCE